MSTEHIDNLPTQTRSRHCQSDWLGLFFIAIVIGGCTGDGCSCAAPIPGGFPPEKRTQNAVQVRLSETGIDVLTQNPNALVTNFLGDDGLIFQVPPTCGADDNPLICCDDSGNPLPTCGPVDIDIEAQDGDLPRVEVAPRTGQNRVDVTLRARVKTVVDLPIVYDIGLFDVECDVSIDTTASGDDSLRVEVPVDLVQDPVAGTTRLEIGTVSIEDFDNGDLSLSGGIDCNIADLLVFAFKGTLLNLVESIVQDTLTEFTCKSCESGDVAECGPFADSCTNAVCMRGEQCLQEIGVSARLAAGTLLGEFSPGTSGALDVYDVLGGYTKTDDRGISLGVLGGALPGGDTSRRCGPSASAPVEITIPETAAFQGNTRPDDGQPFDIAFGIHEHHLAEIVWSAYQSGFLCLNIGTATLDLINSDTMSLLMPSLLSLLHGESAQMVLGIRPQRPPVIKLGRGTFLQDGTGGEIIDEPLFDIDMSDLDVDFYAMVDDQFIRVMTLRADVRLPMNLQSSGDGELTPVLGDLDDAFTNLRVMNADALQETSDFLIDRFPVILDVALPLVANALGPIALPEVAGLRVRVPPGGVTSVDDNRFLAVFAEMIHAPVNTRHAAVTEPRTAETAAQIASVNIPDQTAFDVLDANRHPRIELVFGGTSSRGHSDESLEWSFRINGGTWSLPTRARRVTLSRPSLWLQGRHLIEVRARDAGDPSTTDSTPVTLRPIIDITPPHVVLATPALSARGLGAAGRELGLAWVMASDNVSKGKLRARYRLGQNAWQPIDVPGLIPRALGVEDIDALTVEVEDEVGNRTVARATLDTPPIVDSAPRARGCSVADAPSRASFIGILAICLASLMRRRLKWLTTLFVALGLASAGCGGKDRCDVSDGQVEPGPTGRYSAIAAHGSRVVISAYDEELGDLVLIDVEPTDSNLGRLGEPLGVRQVVDGVPDNLEPSFATCSYRGGVVGDGPDVGTWTSVALADDDGRPKVRIAYHDNDSGQLRFAVEGSSATDWQTHVADAGDGGIAGPYASLALSDDGIPAIAYMVIGIPGADGVRMSELRYARASSRVPRQTSDWSIETIDSVPVSCAGLCTPDQRCTTLDGVERCVAPTTDCAVDCGDDVCVADACFSAIADPITWDIPNGTGLFANLAFLPDGRPVVAFYDRSRTDLMLRIGGDEWTEVPLDSGFNTDTGMWVDMQIDAGGVVHVAYQDAIHDRLLYTTWSDGVTGPIEVIDNGLRANDRPHPVGASASLFVDPLGRISVAYQDGQTLDLISATRDASSWTRNDILTGQNLYGFFVQTATFEGAPIISSYAYQRTDDTLAGLVITRAP